VELFEVQPTADEPVNGRRSDEEDGGVRAKKHHLVRPNRGRGGYHANVPMLVERPPAVMAMMEMVAQPSKVVRVLARGEKLDPDT